MKKTTLEATNLSAYREAVGYLANNSIDNDFGNKGVEHAQIVISEMIGASEKSIVWFSGKFSGDLVDCYEVSYALKNYLEEGGEIKLFLEHDPNDIEEKSDLLSFLMAEQQNGRANISISKISEKVKKKIIGKAVGNRLLHFAVFDGMAYRLEIDTAQRKALCNFNNKQVAEQLLELVI